MAKVLLWTERAEAQLIALPPADADQILLRWKRSLKEALVSYAE